MATPLLPLPADDRITAIRGVIAILRKYPPLKTVVRSWRVWDGSTGETNEPTSNECPWVRVTPAPLESNWFATTGTPVSSQPIRLRIETAVAGTGIDNSILLWSAIESAIYQGGLPALQAIGISGAEVTQPGWGMVDPDAQMVMGDGMITLTYFVTQ